MSRWMPDGMRISPFMKALAIYSAASSVFGWIVLHVPIAEPLQHLIGYLVFVPAFLLHGQAWRVITYPLIDAPESAGALFQSLIFTTLVGFCLFGSQVESSVGRRRTIEVMIAGSVAAALAVTAGSLVMHAWRGELLYGAGPLVGALIVAWGFAYANTPATIWPGLPTTTGKQLTWIFVGISTVIFVLDGFHAAAFGYLAGMGGAALWMLAVRRFGGRGRSTKASARKRRRSGEGLRAIPGGRSDRQMWN